LFGDRLVEEIFGPQPDRAALKRARRQLYRLAGEVPVEHRLPLFRLGPRRLAARLSTLAAWVAERERIARAAIGLVTLKPAPVEPGDVKSVAEPACNEIDAARARERKFTRRRVDRPCADKIMPNAKATGEPGANA
jgi:hypothetical protein